MSYYILLSLHFFTLIVWISSLFYLYGFLLIQNTPEDKIIFDKAMILYKKISSPALLVTILSGVTLLILNNVLLATGFWIYVKFFLISLLILMHLNYKSDINLVKKKLKKINNRVVIPHIYSVFVLLGFIIILVKTKPF